MGLSLIELEKVPSLTHEKVFIRIMDHYSHFFKKWQMMSNSEKSEHLFGNGRTYSHDVIERSMALITSQPERPDLIDTIELAKEVIYRSLEYSYHDRDEYGIKMGAYAHYIINNFNNGQL